MLNRCAVKAIGALLLAAVLAGCASAPVTPPVDTAGDLRDAIAAQGLTDGRGRFREILCAVLDGHGRDQPDFRSCENALRTVGPEAGAAGDPVILEASKADYLMLLVPGLGWNCFEEWLDLSGSMAGHVARYGYEVRTIPIDGLSSSTSNAR